MYDNFYDVVLPQPLIWKAVSGLEGSYEVNNYGQVRSLNRVVTFIRNGRSVSRYFKGRVLKPKYDKNGYESYCLRYESGSNHLRGHRIVALAFVPNKKNLPVVDHKDANVTNNFAWNLQWMTSCENTIKHYAVETDKKKSLASLSKDEWLYIGQLYNEGWLYKDICSELGIDAKEPSTLWDCLGINYPALLALSMVILKRESILQLN